ncbi:MAG: hypothetical protein M3362_23875, partial [Acidobacteriota bacterium]|nr:hypothetical protein [Acidobacteriota bacterium]
MSRKPPSAMARVAILLLLSIAARPAVCQERFEAIPPQVAQQYHLDFNRNFFASPEAEGADRANLYATLKSLESLKGKVSASAKNLERALQLYDMAQVQFHRHYAYLYLRYAVNTGDETTLAASLALDAEMSARTAFLRRELMEVNDRTLKAFLLRQPSLKKYLFAIEDARRYRPYTLSLKEEELLSATAPDNSGWQAELYDKLREGAQINPVNSSEPSAREQAFKQRYAASATQRDLYSFTLIRLATARDRLARLHHFADAPSEAYFNSYWSRAQVDNLLEQIASNSDLYRRYQRLRAEHIKKITGSKDVNLWDMSVREPQLKLPRYTISEAGRVIRAALAPLGPEYGVELAALLDPANGRMDIVPGAHRKRGGFSKGFAGTDSVFYSGGFAGYYNDVRVLTHESTHAVHRQLMNR